MKKTHQTQGLREAPVELSPILPLPATRVVRVSCLAWVTIPLILLGCAVPVHQQRLVSRPSMQFSDSPVFNYQSRLIAQVEPGAAASGGAQAAGCTSCR